MLPLPSSGQCHYTVAFSQDGRWFAAGGSDYAVDVWDLHAPQNPAIRLESLGEPIVRVLFDPNMLLIVYGIHSNRGYDARAWSDGVVSAGGRLFAGGAVTNHPDEYLEVRDPTSGHIVDRFRVTPRPHRVAYSVDRTLAAVLAHGNLSVWNLTTRTAIVDRTSTAHGGWLSVAFDPKGRRIVTGGIDSTVAVWEVPSARPEGFATSGGPPLNTFQWGVGPVYAVVFDRDGLRAAAAGHSGAIVWDVDE